MNWQHLINGWQKLSIKDELAAFDKWRTITDIKGELAAFDKWLTKTDY